MTRKNATIEPLHIWGAHSGLQVRVCYRGRILRSWEGPSGTREDMRQSARDFARAAGFTHANGRSLSAAVYVQLTRDGQTETVDQFDTMAQARPMLQEYRLSDPTGRYYLSRRPCAHWATR